MFWFLLIAMVVVVAAVTLVVVGGGDGVGGGGLRDAEPQRLHDPLPADRPLARADVDAVRFAVTVRGYRMDDVDDALDRLGAELAERDARIAELEAALAGAHAAAMGGKELIRETGPGGGADARPAAPSAGVDGAETGPAGAGGEHGVGDDKGDETDGGRA
ncbi:DivIVA domain-containing protein [Streptomyces gilvosporeus]|uniref:Cell division protein DivIVA n=1 Tax=Streptomyces gilvosporeus TaxID=553510 RepID=A0A1V0TX46_9ACTN|nr:DivIVA domain-containing protein [Streptomyces gilvosporeus]ARF57262.1 cell division protein DivIVA [Streptomyces gilvosporeus]